MSVEKFKNRAKGKERNSEGAYQGTSKSVGTDSRRAQLFFPNETHMFLQELVLRAKIEKERHVTMSEVVRASIGLLRELSHGDQMALLDEKR